MHALQARIQRWIETDPVVVAPESDVQTREYRLCVHVVNPVTDENIPLLIGDCAHCLRQALDHLAYALAVVVNKTDPPLNWEKTQFPITSSLTRFDGGIAEKVGKKKLMPPGLYDTLEKLQPYHGGDRELMGILHALDNLDKHRFPPLVAGVGEVRKFGIKNATGSNFQVPMLGAIEDGKPIMSYIPKAGFKQDLEWDIDFSIAFDRRSTVAPGGLVMPLLAATRLFIRDQVFAPLEAFL